MFSSRRRRSCHLPSISRQKKQERALHIGLIRSLGFYAPSLIVRDAREHGVEVQPADINHRSWENALRPTTDRAFALRLGLCQVCRMNQDNAARIAVFRATAYQDVRDGLDRTGVPIAVLDR